MSRVDAVGLAKQTAVGTKNTTVEYWTPVESADMNDNPEFYSIEETIGNRFPTDEEVGVRFFEAPLALAPRAASFPRVLSAFFGAPTTTALTDAGAKKHLFDPVGKVLVPHSVFLHRADPSPKISDLVWDAFGNEISFSAEPNDFLRASASFVGRDLDDTVSVAPSITSDLTRRWTFDECKVFLSVDGGAESQEQVSAWGLTYQNNLQTDLAVLGSKRLWRIDTGNVTGELTFTPVGSPTSLSAHYRRVLADPRNNVKVRMLAQGSLIGTVDRFEVEVIAYRTRYREGVPPVSAADTLKQLPVTLSIAYDSAATKCVDVAVKNSVASY